LRFVEAIYNGHHSRLRVDDRLENGVYNFRYHPELARDPSLNDGLGTPDYLRYWSSTSVWPTTRRWCCAWGTMAARW
jgi:hypothetical protein